MKSPIKSNTFHQKIPYCKWALTKLLLFTTPFIPIVLNACILDPLNPLSRLRVPKNIGKLNTQTANGVPLNVNKSSKFGAK